MTGSPPPGFRLSVHQGAETLGAEELLLSDVLALGKPVVLNFWAGLCPPCRTEMPSFQLVYEENKEDFILLGIRRRAIHTVGNKRGWHTPPRATRDHVSDRVRPGRSASPRLSHGGDADDPVHHHRRHNPVQVGRRPERDEDGGTGPRADRPVRCLYGGRHHSHVNAQTGCPSGACSPRANAPSAAQAVPAVPAPTPTSAAQAVPAVPAPTPHRPPKRCLQSPCQLPHRPPKRCLQSPCQLPHRPPNRCL